MDFRPTFVTNSEPTVLVEPTDGPFHYPAVDAEAAAVWNVSPGQNRFDAAFSKFFSMGIRVIRPIPLNPLGTAARTTRFTGHGRNGINQRK
jgi:hypothetical protein